MAELIPSIDEVVKYASKVFKDEFGNVPNVKVFAPGRVNLIGEHTDYNEGFVMPMALPLVTVIVGRIVDGEETTIVTTSKNADLPHKITIDMPNKNSLVRTIARGKPKWANYIKGVIANYLGNLPPSFQAVMHTSVPIGGGLSSSAALEVATYTFLDAISGPNTIMPTDKALACQKAEHDYAGLPCGIMDQFISVLGQKDNVLLIDCRSLTSTLVPIDDPRIVVLITNSNVKHELTGSEYPTRRKQCQEAAQLIKKISLRDANEDDINYLISINTDIDIVKRARHVITEIKRTTDAAEALKQKHYAKFGELMIESHKSLRDDFDVSCPEIDQLVELTLEVDGVLGSRITGGGFGGCTVTLVNANSVNNVIANINKNYKGTATFFVCTASDGARKIE